MLLSFEPYEPISCFYSLILIRFISFTHSLFHFLIQTRIFHEGCHLFNQKGHSVGYNDTPAPKEGDEVMMELDLRSNDPKLRRLYFYTNGFQQYIYFYNVPASVHFVCCIGYREVAQFVSYDELKAPLHQETANEHGFDFTGNT